MHKLMPSYLTVTRNSNIFVGDCEKRLFLHLGKGNLIPFVFNAVIPYHYILTQVIIKNCSLILNKDCA
jgi:hypothetical protein